MPWLQVTLMSQRKEFVKLAMVDGANLARLCWGFNISRKTGYKWLARYLREGEAGLRDRGRRPRGSPWVTPPVLEEAVLGGPGGPSGLGRPQNPGQAAGTWL
jgi:hypothetical protein